MTSSRFRWLVGAWVTTYLWFWSFPYTKYEQSAVVKAALEHAGEGAILPQSETLAYLFLTAVFAAAIGLVLYRAWGLWILAASTIASVAISPFLGIGVSTPFGGTIGYITSLLNGAVLAAAMSEPVSRLFRPQTEEPVVEEEFVTVYETSDPAMMPVVHSLLDGARIATTAKFTVKRSDAIVAKDVLELGSGN